MRTEQIGELCSTSRRSQSALALAVPLSQFTPRVGGGSAFVVRRHSHRHVMIARFICLALLVCHAARASGIPDLERVHTSEDLARYISSMTTNDLALSVVLRGLDSTNSITVTPYTVAIPIREIYGTIAEVRFSDKLGSGFYESGKKYGVREICAYQDTKGEVYRFHIGISDERQYHLMKSLIKQRTHHDI